MGWLSVQLSQSVSYDWGTRFFDWYQAPLRPSIPTPAVGEPRGACVNPPGLGAAIAEVSRDAGLRAWRRTAGVRSLGVRCRVVDSPAGEAAPTFEVSESGRDVWATATYPREAHAPYPSQRRLEAIVRELVARTIAALPVERREGAPLPDGLPARPDAATAARVQWWVPGDMFDDLVADVTDLVDDLGAALDAVGAGIIDTVEGGDDEVSFELVGPDLALLTGVLGEVLTRAGLAEFGAVVGRVVGDPDWRALEIATADSAPVAAAVPWPVLVPTDAAVVEPEHPVTLWVYVARDVVDDDYDLLERANEELEAALEGADLGVADEPGYEPGELGSAFVLCGSDTERMIGVARDVLGRHYPLDRCVVQVTDARDRDGATTQRSLT